MDAQFWYYWYGSGVIEFILCALSIWLINDYKRLEKVSYGKRIAKRIGRRLWGEKKTLGQRLLGVFVREIQTEYAGVQFRMKLWVFPLLALWGLGSFFLGILVFAITLVWCYKTATGKP